jgi:hypothetical protein
VALIPLVVIGKIVKNIVKIIILIILTELFLYDCTICRTMINDPAMGKNIYFNDNTYRRIK